MAKATKRTKRRSGPVRLERRVRAARLQKILDAKNEIESCLLTLKQQFKITWADNGFKGLYYLVRLARKSPQRRVDRNPTGAITGTGRPVIGRMSGSQDSGPANPK